jgi:aspartyl-tRNA(Asn)/glutamyl-tRNA(Gln) amidotransferase subunit C
MELSPEQVRRLEDLARLKLTPEEEARIGHDLAGLLALFEQLGQLDLTHYPEMARPIETVNRLRPDQAAAPLSQEEALSVAIEQENGYFKVPRVIE